MTIKNAGMVPEYEPCFENITGSILRNIRVECLTALLLSDLLTFAALNQ